MQQTMLEPIESMPIVEPEVMAWFDGAITTPRGHATCGAVIKRKGYPTVYLSNYIGHGPEMSVNVAEYCGLIMVFEWLKANQIDEALIHGDSEMVILQMRGIQKARGGTYVPYYLKARQWRDLFPKISYQWIRRDLNGEADEMSREPLLKLGLTDESAPDDIDAAFERAIS